MAVLENLDLDQIRSGVPGSNVEDYIEPAIKAPLVALFRRCDERQYDETIVTDVELPQTVENKFFRPVVHREAVDDDRPKVGGLGVIWVWRIIRAVTPEAHPRRTKRIDKVLEGYRVDGSDVEGASWSAFADALSAER